MPKFLFADNADDVDSSLYLVHTQPPRFIAALQGDEEEPQLKMHWLDTAPPDLYAPDVRRLMLEASAYVRRALDE